MDRSRSISRLVAAGLFAAYAAVGYVWARHTAALIEPDVLFHADAPRVLWNETSVGHVQARTVLHPLHVLMTTPIGVPLTAIFGFREFVAVLITAAFAAGCVLAFDALLRRSVPLPAPVHYAFVLLLGLSAGHFTFASIPETHVISAFFLALVACHLAKTSESPIAALPTGPRDWLALFPRVGLVQLLLAAGALVTNVLFAPVIVLLRLSATLPWLRRALTATVLSGGLVLLLGGLYVAQRAVLFGAAPPPSAAAPAPAPAEPAIAEVKRPPRQPGPVGWFRERFERELRYVTWQPSRGLEVGLATAAFNIYAPRVKIYTLPPNPEGPPPGKLPAVRLDYLAFDLRPAGALGAAAWGVALLLALASLLVPQRAKRFIDSPTSFSLLWLGFYFVVFNLYHVYPIDSPGGNDVFLFAPNLVFPMLFLVAAAYARGGLAERVWPRRAFYCALGVATIAAAVNTGLHVRDLLAIFVTHPSQ